MDALLHQNFSVGAEYALRHSLLPVSGIAFTTSNLYS